MPFKFTFKGHQRKSPAELVAVDIGNTGLKVVKVRKSKDGLVVEAADILPSFPELTPDTRLALPKNLMANYTALMISGESAVVRILNLPSQDIEQMDMEQLREHVGLGEDFRVGHAVVAPQRGKAEAKVLVVGIPEQQAESVLSLVPYGPPAPFSIEVAGLAALTAFLRGPGTKHAQEAVAVIESGAKVTFMALFNKNVLSLVRKFDFGSETFVARVQQQLGVDRETAMGVVADGSFDISQIAHEVMDPFLRQFSISRDFVERREDSRVADVYLSGGASLSRYWLEEIQGAVGINVHVWNPFENLRLAPDAYPANLEGQQTRFTAAVGACLGVFQET